MMSDPNDDYAEISQTCRYYIGGLMDHARSLCAFTNPTTNSYRRLVPGYEAPVFIAWSKRNRGAIIRIPMYYQGIEAAKRLEYRTPGAACNPRYGPRPTISLGTWMRDPARSSRKADGGSATWISSVPSPTAAVLPPARSGGPSSGGHPSRYETNSADEVTQQRDSHEGGE